jgi:hypothetical protein
MTDEKRFKDFGSGGQTENSPISFMLHGEEFVCIPQIQGKLLLDLVSESSSNDPVKSAGIVTKFFNYVLEDESTERFNKLLEDKHKIVSVEALADITAWLVQEYTDRPNQQPEA